MAERTDIDGRRHAKRRDDGFTLVEVLIVVVTMGVIAAAIAASMTVIWRTTPPAEARTEDARSVQGLVTWLPQDVDAAPPSGFNRNHTYWPCGGPAPVSSPNIVTAEWTEDTGVITRYAASYRYEKTDERWTMVRYACDSVGAGPMGLPERVNLTSSLPEWNPWTPPAWVEMCATTVSVGATCPVADVIPPSVTAPSAVYSMKLNVKRVDGEVATIDAAPKNPDQDLADDPDVSTNHPPVLSQVNYTLQMYAGETQMIDLYSTHGASDPDGDPISAALDSTEPLPTGITALTSDPMFLEVTTDPSLGTGVLSPRIVVIVSDNKAGWVDATVTIEIIPKPNHAPTATSLNYDLYIPPNEDVTLPLDATHGVVDPDGDILTGIVLTYPSGMTNPPKFDGPGPLDLDVKTPGSVTPGTTAPIPIALELSDGRGGLLSITITVHYIVPPSNQAPTATTSNITVDMYPNDTLSLDLVTSHGVVEPDGDAVSVTDINSPGAIAVTLDGPLEITLDTDPTAAIGTYVVSLDVEDVYEASLTITVTVNVIPAPPPPSDCVLGGLSASPSTVDRQGSGTVAHPLDEDVTVTITYSGTCDGLALTYDSGDSSGLGTAPGRVFPPGSPSSIVIASKGNGGTEKFTPEPHVLTATTTSDVSPNSISTTLTVM